MYSIKLKNSMPSGYTNEKIGPGSQNIRGQMGGTSKSFGMKLDKIHNYEERPGPQNYSPVEP